MAPESLLSRLSLVNRFPAMHRLLLTLALLGLLPAARLRSAPERLGSTGNDPPTPAELHALIGRVLANQHADDQAIASYERIDHRMVREHPNAPILVEDKLLRVVPTGTGTVSVQIEDHGRPIDPALYHREMLDLEKALEDSADPDNARAREDRERFQQHVRERGQIVDAMFEAYRYTWLGRETRDGRVLLKFHMDPDPAYKPSSRFTEFLRHGAATVWVDEQAAQVVRIETELTSDVSFVGGVFGKVYRGGRMVLEQAEVQPGIWLPMSYQYDFVGRKLLFLFEIHERREESHYQRIGPPNEALIAIRRELSGNPPNR
jgi:hypothetical protein